MLKSVDSNIRAFVKFHNTTERCVEVLWINFQGVAIQYTFLDPGATVQINTYCTHPWVFVCIDSGERLQVNRKHIFYGDAWYKYVVKAENGVVSVGRQDAKIHFPLKTLRGACLRRITTCITDKKDISRLEIPDTLKVDLFDCCERTIKFADRRYINQFLHHVDDDIPLS